MPTLISFSASLSGAVDYRQTDQDFSTLHDAATGTAVNSGSSPFLSASSILSKFDELRRAFFLFDTSALTTSATIISATLILNVSAKVDQLSQSVDIITTTPASTSVLDVADFDQVGTVLQATSLTIASITTSADNTWTLNATGLSNISKTGITKFGARLSSDTANSAPGWVISNQANITWSNPRLNVVIEAGSLDDCAYFM